MGLRLHFAWGPYPGILLLHRSGVYSHCDSLTAHDASASWQCSFRYLELSLAAALLCWLLVLSETVAVTASVVFSFLFSLLTASVVRHKRQ